MFYEGEFISLLIKIDLIDLHTLKYNLALILHSIDITYSLLYLV